MNLPAFITGGYYLEARYYPGRPVVTLPCKCSTASTLGSSLCRLHRFFLPAAGCLRKTDELVEFEKIIGGGLLGAQENYESQFDDLVEFEK